MADSVIDWDVTTEKLSTLSKNLIAETKERCKNLIEATKRDHQTLTDLNELERLLGNGSYYLNILKSVHPNKDIRDVCKDACSELSKLNIELEMNKSIFDLMEETRKNLDGQLDPESKRYLDNSILERRLDGLHLDEETRKVVIDIKKKISDLSIDFSKNCSEESTKLTFTAKELDGVSSLVLDKLPKNENGDYIVSLTYSVYFPIIKECKVPATRRKLAVSFDRRCIDVNTKIFEEILVLRSKLAKILGFKTYSEYCLVTLCAKSPENVEKFLDKLKDKMRILQKKEMAALLEYKRQECQELGIEFDGKINPSDLRYYLNMREKKEFKVDHSKLQEYFPLNVVFEGTFKIYQLLLGLKFEEVKDTLTYHEEVKLFRVLDTQTNQIVGHFYTDLHPREGKYSHAAVFGIKKGCHKSNQLPVCMMVCNFTKPSEDSPSLLTHDEVETFFHEFGHVMHQICTKANYFKFGGTSVERDFVEAPSQMLENWVWNKESLKLLSSHYKDGSAIDEKLLDDLIKSKNTSEGCFNMRQILFAKMDQYFHSHEKSDSAAIYREYVKEYMLYELEDTNMNMNASFEHLTGGYEAQYYSYLWSEVYSADMFERFKNEGILNPKTGLDYREKILAPGGSIDAKDMVFNFLGREPNEIAFLRSKGVDV